MSRQDAARTAPDAAEIERLADAALAALPDRFRRLLGTVVVLVDDLADDETLDAMGIDDPLDLTGLYRGRPVGEKSSMDPGTAPDMIHLYRRAILDEWVATGVALDALVTNVVVHEVGHHFGLSDDDIDRLES